MDMKINPKLLVKERNSRAWSQQHLAEVAELSLRTVQRIETTGNSSPESAKAIAAAFNLKPQDLVLQIKRNYFYNFTSLQVLIGTIFTLSIPIAYMSFFALSANNIVAESDTKSPTILETFPINGSTEIDSSVKEISVTFSEPMTDNSWSWVMINKALLPKITGQPVYKFGFTKNILPVKLKPNTHYEIWINSNKFNSFKDKDGNSVKPFRLVFKTK